MIKELPVSTGSLNGHFLLVALGVLVWLVGGNLIIARQFKRRGMSSAEGFKLGGLLKVSLNLREAAALLGVAVAALTLIALGAERL